MRKDFYQRVKKYILDLEMIRPGESVVAGVSGGADSVCLFLVLEKLSGEMGFCLQVVHVHHGLRESALGDQRFVESLCAENGVRCVCVRADAAAMAREWGTGIEEAGRRIRYEAFENTRRELEAERGTPCRIALAHHREDQAETVLFHLCRGTDIRGARGMLPVNGSMIRPLLCESRASIEAFLTEAGRSWCEDETNQDTSYTRNYLRREILPRLAEGVNPAAAERIAQFAASCADAERFLEKATAEALRRCIAGKNIPQAGAGPAGSEGQTADAGPAASEEPSVGAGPAASEGPTADAGPAAGTVIRPEGSPACCLSLEALGREDPCLQGRILFQCLANAAGTRRDLSSVHVEAVRALCEGGGDGMLDMPGRTCVLRRGKYLIFRKKIKTGSGPDARTEEAFGIADQGSGRAENAFGTVDQGSGRAENAFGTANQGSGRAENAFGTANQGSGYAESTFGTVDQSIGKGTFPSSAEEYTCTIRDFDGCMSVLPQKEYTKWFDYDRIGMFPVFRSRQPGDRMTLRNSASDEGMIRKKLARIMLDGRIPAGVRDCLVLPFRGDEALWVPGLRMGDACKVTASTKRILEISWNPGETGSDPGKKG